MAFANEAAKPTKNGYKVRVGHKVIIRQGRYDGQEARVEKIDNAFGETDLIVRRKDRSEGLYRAHQVDWLP